MKIQKILINKCSYVLLGTPQPDGSQGNGEQPVQIIQQSELNVHQVNQLLQQLQV